VLFALGILIAHAIAGTHAKVSLGSFPAAVDRDRCDLRHVLGALGGWIARTLRERNAPADKAA